MSVISFPWQQGGGQNGGIHEDYTMPLTKDQTLAVATFSTPAIGDIREDDVSSTISRNTGAGGGTQNPAFVAVAFTASEQSNGFAWERPISGAITAQVPNDTSNNQSGVRIGMQVRRLTPVECERLQGFPDDYTLVLHRNKLAADGPRYKALGNSMAVPCMTWIGSRIQMVEDLLNDPRSAG